MEKVLREREETDELSQIAENEEESEAGSSSGSELMEGVQELTQEEALRLLEAVEEGRPYVVVGGESSEKDW